MATLVAIGYTDQGTAEQARETVARLEADLVIQADQVASISRDPEGKYHVHTSHGGASAGAGAWWGGFWGFLFGLLFFIPFAGLALGAGMGALFNFSRNCANAACSSFGGAPWCFTTNVATALCVRSARSVCCTVLLLTSAKKKVVST